MSKLLYYSTPTILLQLKQKSTIVLLSYFMLKIINYNIISYGGATCLRNGTDTVQTVQYSDIQCTVHVCTQ